MNSKLIAKQLDAAAVNASPISQFSLVEKYSIDQAYEIQEELLHLRYKRGEQLVGLKMGFTSIAKMEQMGVHDMIWGRLTNTMNIGQFGICDLSTMCHPRVEPEIVFRIKKTIDREISTDEIPDYVDGIAAALEIIDSRYENFKFSLEDVVADNCSSIGFVLGDWQAIREDLTNLDITMKMNDEVVQKGSTNAILGNPWDSLIATSRLTAQYDQVIPAGTFLLAGSATPAVFLKPNSTIKGFVTSLGEVSFTTK